MRSLTIGKLAQGSESCCGKWELPSITEMANSGLLLCYLHLKLAMIEGDLEELHLTVERRVPVKSNVALVLLKVSRASSLASSSAQRRSDLQARSHRIAMHRCNVQ
jgi:hypothetical protein